METIYYVAFSVAAAIIVILSWYFVKKARPSIDTSISSDPLPSGWQFYSKPTTLEPPGTVFRIDPDKKTYIVDVLKVKTQKGNEAFGKVQTSVQAKTSIIVSFLGLKNVSVSSSAKKNEQVTLEMQNLVREILTDKDLDPIIKPFLEGLDYRIKNRYFVIREATTVKEINFRLSKNQVGSLGGEASLKKALSMQGTIHSSKQKGSYVLQQKFEKPMRIMFLPEEIKPVSAGLGGKGPELGLVPVKDVLEWDRG